MQSAGSSSQEGTDRRKANNTSAANINVLPDKMKKIELKPSESPTSFLARNSVLLPSGVARVKQLSGIQTSSSSSSSGAMNVSASTSSSSGSATGNPRNKTALAPGHSLMDWIRLGSSNVDLTGVGGVHQVVTVTELAKHNKRDDAWIAIRGVVFNVTRYMDFHPGGVDELMKGVGKDATKIFEDVHAWVNYQSILQRCVVGRLSRSAETLDNPFMSNKITGDKLSSSSLDASDSENETPKIEPINIENNWKQTTYRITFMYKIPLDQLSTSYQLIRQSDTEVMLKIHLSNGVLRHEYDFFEAIEWPPVCCKNHETSEIEFIFTKVCKKVWRSYGTRTVVNEATCVERSYREWQVISNNSLCENVHLLILRSKDYMEILPTGRHVEVKMNVMGTEVSRPYTPVPPYLHPDDMPPDCTPDCLCLMVKRYDDGALSPSITALKQGQSLILSNGLGTFVVESFDDYSAVHMLAAGTGLTPMLGIIQRALCRRNITKLNLINFNATERNIFYKRQLEKLVADERLTMVNVLSRADDSWTGRRGIVTQDLLYELIGDINKQSCVFMCGPKNFMALCQRALENLGWKAFQLHKFDG